jgi:hypothetical protein
LEENLEPLEDKKEIEIKPEIEIEKPKKTATKTKKNFDKLSIEIPKGWQAEEDEDSGAIGIKSPNEKVGIIISLTYSEDKDSKEFIEAILSVIGNSGSPKKVKGTDFYKATFRGEKGIEGTMFAGTEDDLGDMIAVGGNHSALPSILRSIKAKGKKRPHLDKMIDAAITTLKADDEPDDESDDDPEDDPKPKPKSTPKPKQKTPITKLDLPAFSIEMPKGWKSQTDKKTGLVSFASADNKSALAILLSASEELESKEWMDLVLSTFPFSDTAEPVKGGYYKSEFTNPNGIKGFIVAGAKDNLADTITVMGEHPALNQMLLSIKAKQKRPYLDKMIADITGKKTNKPISVDEDENDIDENDEDNENDEPETEKKPVPKKVKKTTALDLESYKVNFKLQEIHDPQLNNELAVTIAVPDGWKIKDRNNVVQWNSVTYTSHT